MKTKIVSRRDLFVFFVIVSIFASNIMFAIAQTPTPTVAPGGGGWVAPAQPTGVMQDINKAVMNITNWILGFIALIAVLAIIWGGVQYVTSVGNDTQMESAKKTIQWAVMGLVVAGLAYAIVYVIVAVILKAS